VLDEAAALALLQSLVGDDRIQAELDEARLLCEQLGYLPLGLELVGRYVDRKPDLSLADMRRRLQAKQLAAQALCQPDADMTAQLGVAAAFQLSWETLSEDAKQLGYLLSLFAVAPIPWSLVEQCCEDRDPEDLEETRDSELLNLHLLQRTATTTYRIHPLIREFFGAQLERYQEADGLKRQFCHVMAFVSKQIPERATREQILTVAPLIAHLAKTATTLKAWLSHENLTAPYEGLGLFYYEQGAYAEAEPWWQQGLSISISQLGQEHPVVADNLNNLAFLYDSQGRYSEAEPLHVQALRLRQRILGEDHPDVASSLNNLATLYIEPI
jgi:tetratricopeptide (TPR) repeat protein